MNETLTIIAPGLAILYDGNQVARVPDEVAERFQPGDRLLVVSGTGEVLRVPHATHDLVHAAVGRAHAALQQMNIVGEGAITAFYAEFASRLADDQIWARIAMVNAADVDAARARGRSSTRLAVSDKMRRDMIKGLQGWQAMPPVRGRVVETVEHEGWAVEQVLGGLGVVGFVFEGRPNVFADATGVLRSGNTAVLRIGSDALRTARTIEDLALQPALRDANLPDGAIALIDSTEHAAGWALFSDPRLALAVARGSGRAVAQLGSIARQHGAPVSLHGTGGAWLVAGSDASLHKLSAAVYHSLDRKVCNTVNVLLVERCQDTPQLVSGILDAVRRRGTALGTGFKLHVLQSARPFVPVRLFEERVQIHRAQGPVEEAAAEPLGVDQLGQEWEWEGTPEVSLGVVDSIDEAIALFNRYSPRFSASFISESAEAQDHFFNAIDAPFAGDGFTRWVDGQFALNRPELGLSNWQHGRLFGRGGVLSGDGVYTVRLRARQEDPELHR